MDKVLKPLIFLLYSGLIQAQAPSLNPAGFYAGISDGLGSTTWNGLVPKAEKQNSAILISTPTLVKEGGGVYGFFGGYDFTPHFGLELVYLQYPDARVTFSKYSLFAFKHQKRTFFDSSTQSLGLLAKIMLNISDTPFRLYSAAGLARLHRQDELLERSRFTPTFAFGLVYNMTEHLMSEFSFNYTAGYGESELNPCGTYIPFVYSGTFGLAYKF